LAIVDLPALGRPVSQTTHGRCALSAARARLSTSTGCQRRFAPRRSAKSSIPRPDGVVRDAVDEDEPARLAVLPIGVERQRAVELEVDCPDLVELEAIGGEVVHGRDVDLVLDRRCGRRRLGRAEAQQVAAPAQHRLLGHPDDGRAELVGHHRRVGRRGEDVAAADVDLVGERQRDRLPADRARRGRRRT
jgi:hypothetical protein